MGQETLHVGRPNIAGIPKALGYIEQVLQTGWLTNNGPFVQRLERELAERLGVKFVTCVCNATIGLQILISALVGENTGEVIVPAFTFVATAQAIVWANCQPVFADSNPHDHGLDAASVETLITPRTRAIIGVHLWGGPCDVLALQRVADTNGLPLVFDAAHAFDARLGSTKVGNFGKAEVFSFHATKVFNCAEGGAIATNDEELHAKLCLMRNFGFAGVDRVVTFGTNGKMSEIAACVGLGNLPHVAAFIADNRAKYEYFHAQIARLPGFRVFEPLNEAVSNHHYFVVEVDEQMAGLSRDKLVAALWDANILARRYFTPGLHRVPPFGTPNARPNPRFPVVERLAREILVLPTGPSVSFHDIDRMVEIMDISRQSTANGAWSGADRIM